MKKLLFLGTLLILILFIYSCRSSRYVVRERPIEPHYVQPLAPGANYIWHGGYWIRGGNGYTYHNGYWMRPSSGRRHFTSGHWQRRRRGWVWMSGRWRY